MKKHPHLIGSGLTCFLSALLLVPMVSKGDDHAAADSVEPTVPEDAITTGGGGGDDLGELAKKSINPLSDIWMAWVQNDTFQYRGDLIDGDQWLNATIFQPVMSFPLTEEEDYNLIIRPIFNYLSLPLDEEAGELLSVTQNNIRNSSRLQEIAADPFGRTNGFGDTALWGLVGPNKKDGWIWGVGATSIWPTAGEDILGAGKFQAGPVAMIVRIAPDPGGSFLESTNIGALVQQWWSYAGESERAHQNHMNVQYFINYRLTPTKMIGMAPNLLVDWNAEDGNKVTFPLGLGYTDIIRLGDLPVRVGIEGQYTVVSPDDAGSNWGVRVVFAPLLQNPIKAKRNK